MGALIAITSIYLIDDREDSNAKIRSSTTFEEKQSYSLVGNSSVAVGVDFTVAAELSTPGVVHIKTFQDVSNMYQQPGDWLLWCQKHRN